MSQEQELPKDHTHSQLTPGRKLSLRRLYIKMREVSGFKFRTKEDEENFIALNHPELL